MNKKEFAGKLKVVVENVVGVKVTQAQAEEILKGHGDIIVEALENREEVKTPYGAYELAIRAPRTGRNPATGAEIQIPETYGMKLKVSKTIKDRLNGKTQA